MQDEINNRWKERRQLSLLKRKGNSEEEAEKEINNEEKIGSRKKNEKKKGNKL